ncbi:MAG: 1,4-dihydroxy-6-naphthoate synthase [Lewinellaceae bacterium]|nr:1,4-dihydroxy-6-naphthoate synthase [Lewinellaceae bacterium]
MQQLSLGFSPCPNDTFIFDALIHGKIDTEGLEFEVIMEDVEALNKKAFQGDIHITKLSYHAFAHLTESYNLLNSGSALGKNCGPLLIAKEFMSPEQINRAGIAIPGAMTTANFLLGLAYPEAKNKTAVLFSEIEDSVLSGQYEAGLIIHENRFTYEQKGLKKLIDLGEYWESSTGFPIPLGGIVINRALPLEIQQKVNRALKKSVEYAFANQDDVMPFVRQYAQEMDEAVMRAHINLYVNNFSVDLGEAGKQAIMAMFNTAREKGLIPGFRTDFFVPV